MVMQDALGATSAGKLLGRARLESRKQDYCGDGRM